jgi:phosphoribosylformylglycinamidine synthase
MALDFKGKEGIATSIGHAPISSLIDPVAGWNAIAESLSNLVWAPLKRVLIQFLYLQIGCGLVKKWRWRCSFIRSSSSCSDFAIN